MLYLKKSLSPTGLNLLWCAALIATTLSVANVEGQITGLFNTGVDNLGNPLALYGQDPHYALIASADPNCPTNLAPRVEGLVGTWVNSNNAISNWIRPEQLGNGFPPFNLYGICNNGGYVYRTSFNAAGNLSLLSITGRLAADDDGVSVTLNGGTPLITGPAGFSSYTNFAINSGFIAGTNTLDFLVNNLGGAPTGLRVEMVPEPLAATLSVLGFGGFALLRRTW